MVKITSSLELVGIKFFVEKIKKKYLKTFRKI